MNANHLSMKETRLAVLTHCQAKGDEKAAAAVRRHLEWNARREVEKNGDRPR